MWWKNLEHPKQFLVLEEKPVTIPVCCRCRGSGSLPAGEMIICRGQISYTSQRMCGACRGDGGGNC